MAGAARATQAQDPPSIRAHAMSIGTLALLMVLVAVAAFAVAAMLEG
jgi:hypothetical protein